MFDMNDFDESPPGSFDGRQAIAVSMAGAAEANGLKDKDVRKAARSRDDVLSAAPWRS